MSTGKFDIVITGQRLPAETRAELEGKLAKAFRTKLSRVKQLLDGRNHVIKRQLTREQAASYIRVLKKIGVPVRAMRAENDKSIDGVSDKTRPVGQPEVTDARPRPTGVSAGSGRADNLYNPADIPPNSPGESSNQQTLENENADPWLSSDTPSIDLKSALSTFSRRFRRRELGHGISKLDITFWKQHIGNLLSRLRVSRLQAPIVLTALGAVGIAIGVLASFPSTESAAEPKTNVAPTARTATKASNRREKSTKSIESSQIARPNLPEVVRDRLAEISDYLDSTEFETSNMANMQSINDIRQQIKRESEKVEPGLRNKEALEQLPELQAALDREQVRLETIRRQHERKAALYESRDITITEFEAVTERLSEQRRKVSQIEQKVNEHLHLSPSSQQAPTPRTPGHIAMSPELLAEEIFILEHELKTDLFRLSEDEREWVVVGSADTYSEKPEYSELKLIRATAESVERHQPKLEQLKKGEFEKTAEYRKRVATQEIEHSKRMEQFQKSIGAWKTSFVMGNFQEYFGAPYVNDISYDADMELFRIGIAHPAKKHTFEFSFASDIEGAIQLKPRIKELTPYLAYRYVDKGDGEGIYVVGAVLGDASEGTFYGLQPTKKTDLRLTDMSSKRRDQILASKQRELEREQKERQERIQARTKRYSGWRGAVLLDGALVCTSFKSGMKASIIARANNPYLPTPNSCEYLDGGWRPVSSYSLMMNGLVSVRVKGVGLNVYTLQEHLDFP